MDFSPQGKSVTFIPGEDIFPECQRLGWPVGLKIVGDDTEFVVDEGKDIERTIGAMGCHEDEIIRLRHVAKTS